MDIKDTIQKNINRVAETHFFLRPQLMISLKGTIITELGKKYALGCSNYLEFWEKSLSEKFFDMGTLIRLGAEIEKGLRDYYMEKKGHRNLRDLKRDPNFEIGIFQRVLPGKRGNVVNLFRDQLDYDLESNSRFKKIQQIMLCRNLYAHNSGLLDDTFITRYGQLTSIDLRLLPEIQDHYPDEDVYYFAPLEELGGYIENVRSFFEELP
jgi:hypothetical protein